MTEIEADESLFGFWVEALCEIRKGRDHQAMAEAMLGAAAAAIAATEGFDGAAGRLRALAARFDIAAEVVRSPDCDVLAAALAEARLSIKH